MRNFLLFFTFFISVCGAAQQLASDVDSVEAKSSVVEFTDSLTQEKKARSPFVASWLSAAVPGAGQIYNRKYWKAPIVWGGFIGLFLVHNFQSDRYNFYKQILIYQEGGGANQPLIDYIDANGSRFTNLSGSELLAQLNFDANIETNFDSARKRRQQVIVGAVLFYVIQIVDATVDAHFSTFEVSEDLTLDVSPAIFPSLPSAQGVKLSFNF